MEQTSFITSKCGTQSAKYSMHCINYANREQEKPLLFKLTLRSRFTLSQAQSVSCHELLVVYGQSTLNSNRTKHKRRKKLANQKRRHMYFRQFCPIRSYPAPGSTKPLCYTGYALYRRFRASATKAT